MTLKLRRSRRTSGSGARSLVDQVRTLTQKCAELERDSLLLSMDERLREMARRLTALETIRNSTDS